MTGVLDFFKNSPYFDKRTENVTVYEYDLSQDDTGEDDRTRVSATKQLNTFISPVKREKMQKEYLEQYSVLNFVYIEQEIDLQNEKKEYIIGVNGQEFKVLDYHGRFLTSGFFKYLVGGTGNVVE